MLSLEPSKNDSRNSCTQKLWYLLRAPSIIQTRCELGSVNQTARNIVGNANCDCKKGSQNGISIAYGANSPKTKLTATSTISKQKQIWNFDRVAQRKCANKSYARASALPSYLQIGQEVLEDITLYKVIVI